uniref:Uncharacterized protein n=1 Tax=Laticauda laticaudata TaxID=8630 RepID=A0A8C5RXY8_LATLA
MKCVEQPTAHILERPNFPDDGVQHEPEMPPPTFLLVGIRGLEASSAWISLPFCFLYAAAILGSSADLLAIVKNHNLHNRMYLFLSCWGCPSSPFPPQLFFIHCFSIMDLEVLWALYRFVIYKLLQSSSLLTADRIARIGLGTAVKNIVLLTPLPLLRRKLPFCEANVLPLPCCLHPDLIRLPCADNGHYGLFVLLCTFGLDSLLTIFISSREGCLKALSTCVSHISAGVLCHTPMIGLCMAYRFGRHVSPLVRSLLAHIYLLLPLLLNPSSTASKQKKHPRLWANSFHQRGSSSEETQCCWLLCCSLSPSSNARTEGEHEDWPAMVQKGQLTELAS